MQASLPGRFTLSPKRLRMLCADSVREGSAPSDALLGQCIRQMQTGDVQPAVVICVKPLRIAVYSADLDCVCMQAPPQKFAPLLDLAVGVKLAAVQWYDFEEETPQDLQLGPNSMHRRGNMMPLIADLLSESEEELSAKKRCIPEQQWLRAWRYGKLYMQQHPTWVRSAEPGKTGVCAVAFEAGEAQA